MKKAPVISIKPPSWEANAKTQANIHLHKLYKNVICAWKINGTDVFIESFMCYNENKKDFEIIQVQILQQNDNVVILFSKTEAFDSLEIPA